MFGRAIAEGRFSDDTIDKHFGGKDEAMHEAARLLETAAARGRHVQDIERHLTLIAEHLNKVLLNIVLRYFTARVVTTFHGSDDRLLIFYSHWPVLSPLLFSYPFAPPFSHVDRTCGMLGPVASRMGTLISTVMMATAAAELESTQPSNRWTTRAA